jgi:hypothetical protein
MYILSYETLENSIKENTQQMRKDSSLSQKKNPQSGSQRGKGRNYVLNTPPIARSILKKERDEKLEKAISLENLHLQQRCISKYRSNLSFYKATNTFYL